MEEIKPSTRIEEIVKSIVQPTGASESDFYVAAIMKYLDEQSAKCSEPTRDVLSGSSMQITKPFEPSPKEIKIQGQHGTLIIQAGEPSKCEHKWSSDLSEGFRRCKKCDEGEPSDSGGAKEIEELAASFRRISSTISDTTAYVLAQFVICEGYSKHPKYNEITPGWFKDNKGVWHLFDWDGDLYYLDGVILNTKSNDLVALDENELIKFLHGQDWNKEYPDYPWAVQLSKSICSKFGQNPLVIPSVESIQEILMKYIPYKVNEIQVAQAIRDLIKEKK